MKFEVVADLVQTRGITVPADGFIDEAQDLLLPLRQDHAASPDEPKLDGLKPKIKRK
jgi:hypothetical protein